MPPEGKPSIHLSRGFLLPTGGVAGWLSWPISRDQWLNRFGMHAFQIRQGKIGFGQFFSGEMGGGQRLKRATRKPLFRVSRLPRPSRLSRAAILREYRLG